MRTTPPRPRSMWQRSNACRPRSYWPRACSRTGNWRRRRASSAPISCSMATTSKPCACLRRSASRATCWTTRSCCSKPSSRSRPTTAPRATTMRWCWSSVTSTSRRARSSRSAARSNYGDAYWSLANLKTYRFLDEEIARMRADETAPGTPLVDRYHLCFALGKAYEDRSEYAESWRYYERGNAFKRSESRYRPEIIENNTRKQIETCTREFFATREGVGAKSPDPIFVVGLPRSGSTLLEQILASHSRVEGTQELSDIQRIVLDLQGRVPDLDNPRYPGVLAGMTPEDFLRLGEKYLADTRVYRTDKPHFVDKMPNNFRHLGLIHLMLPNTRIIDARREPMACCFSNLKQLFA